MVGIKNESDFSPVATTIAWEVMCLVGFIGWLAPRPRGSDIPPGARVTIHDIHEGQYQICRNLSG